MALFVKEQQDADSLASSEALVPSFGNKTFRGGRQQKSSRRGNESNQNLPKWERRSPYAGITPVERCAVLAPEAGTGTRGISGVLTLCPAVPGLVYGISERTGLKLHVHVRPVPKAVSCEVGFLCWLKNVLILDGSHDVDRQLSGNLDILKTISFSFRQRWPVPQWKRMRVIRSEYKARNAGNGLDRLDFGEEVLSFSLSFLSFIADDLWICIPHVDGWSCAAIPDFNINIIQ